MLLVLFLNIVNHRITPDRGVIRVVLPLLSQVVRLAVVLPKEFHGLRWITLVEWEAVHIVNDLLSLRPRRKLNFCLTYSLSATHGRVVTRLLERGLKIPSLPIKFWFEEDDIVMNALSGPASSVEVAGHRTVQLLLNSVLFKLSHN